MDKKFTLHYHAESECAWINDHWEGIEDGLVEPLLIDVSLEEANDKLLEMQSKGIQVTFYKEEK